MAAPDDPWRALADHLAATGALRPAGGSDGPTLCEIVAWEPLGGGRSATTILVTAVADGRGAERLVVHLQPDTGPLAGISDAEWQVRLLTALGGRAGAPEVVTGLPVDVLGRPGYVTRFVTGEVPDPWRRSGRAYLAEHGPTMLDDLVDHLALLHRIPVDVLPARPEQDANFARREWRRWSDVLGASGFAAEPVLDAADRWLAAHLPSETPAALVHGDYRVGNLVFRDGRLTAVLDWELAEIGDPLYDLATLCSPALSIDGRAGGLAAADELVGRYERAAGTSVDRDRLRFYVVLSTFKIACLWVNASRSYVEGVDDLVALRAAYSVHESVGFVAAAMDLPEPRRGPADRELSLIATTLAAMAARAADRTDRDTMQLLTAILRGRARYGAASASEGA